MSYCIVGLLKLMALTHRRLQNFETTQAKIEGWGLLGVERGVVLIICGCGHFANGLIMPRLSFASFLR